MRTVVVIQARMGSTRLPGKILKHVAGTTVLGHVIRRVQAAAGVDAVVVATTTLAADDPVLPEAERYGALTVRGSEDDVLSRYQLAAQESRAEVVVRVTADCPLLDPEVLAQMIQQFHAQRPAGTDYLSNTLQRTYPRGLDVEVFTAQSLAQAHREAVDPHEREHVTPYMYRHPERFKIEQVTRSPDVSHHRWTLDTAEDLRLIEAIYAALYREGSRFTTEEVLTFLESRPDLVALNAHIEQKKVPLSP